LEFEKVGSAQLVIALLFTVATLFTWIIVEDLIASGCAASPCIDKGANNCVVGTHDAGGNPRINNGTVDVGAFEWHGVGQPTSASLAQARLCP